MKQALKILFKPQRASSEGKLNWLRAAVLGANDGIVSISGLVLGVAAASNSTNAIFNAGVAGIIAGAISMAAGEYVSVSSTRDTERAELAEEKRELASNPEDELEELAKNYQKRGLTAKTAMTVAKELSEHHAFQAHAEIELRIDPEDLNSPKQAAIASALSFLAGASIPLIAILLPPANLRIPIAFAAVIVSLVITGTLSAKVGGANILQAIFRIVTWGILAMTITYVIGRFFGVSGI